jgi:hypothetical protein
MPSHHRKPAALQMAAQVHNSAVKARLRMANLMGGETPPLRFLRNGFFPDFADDRGHRHEST